MNTADKLMAARCRLMTREPWYGHIAMSMMWIPSQMSDSPEETRTMGVRIVNGGEVQCLYYPPFVDKLSLKELYAVVQHEIEHIVRLHCVRVSKRHPLVWNVAADMTVNGLKSAPRIGYCEHTSNQVVIPFKDKLVWIPSKWPSDQTTEYYYDKLVKDMNADGSNRESDAGGDHGSASHYGKLLDNHDVWRESDVSEDEARQVIKDMVDQASEKCQGSIPGHLASAIAALKKPVIHWRELLRHYFGKHVGNHRLTFSRRNRRRDEFGIPGFSHHAAAHVNVIIDTSGSVSDQELAQFFAEIDAIASRAKTHVLQWDHAFQGFAKYRRGDWKKIKVHGRGGTDMAAPVKWLKDNKLVADVQVMLTDGVCNYLPAEEVNFPMITVLTRPTTHHHAVPEYGHVVKMT